MKSKILHHLSSQSDVISGEQLSDRLGISRVSIWKHIKRLQELGYGIESTPKGYRLVSRPDALYPWEFPGREDRIHYAERTPSTMQFARDLARKGCPHFTAAAAGIQTKGRGRLDRTWVSDKGGLYFTLVVRPDIPPVLSSRINFAASFTLAKVMRELYGIEAAVKWPNDILVDGRKITGMLSEMEVDADMVSFVNIGMGTNVNNDPTADEPNAVSLKILLGKTVSRRDLLAAFLDAFEDEMACIDYDEVVSRWKTMTMTIGRQVRIVTNNGEFEGKAVDVADDGSLMLQQSDGSVKAVIYGDCFFPPEKE